MAAQHLVGFADGKLTAAALVAEQIESASSKDAELLKDIATRVVNVPERPLDLPGEIERLRIAALTFTSMRVRTARQVPEVVTA